MTKKVLLVGGFHKTKSLAESLLKKNYHISVINDNYEHYLNLSENDALTVIYGDGSQPFILEKANAAQADIVIALTRRDDDNLVICQLCKKMFNVEKTVSLVSDPKKIEFFQEMGVDSVVCAINAITNLLEQQALINDMQHCTPMANGRVTVAEVLLPKSSPVIDKKIWELGLAEGVIIGCILRHDQQVIPNGNTSLLAGDVLVVITAVEHLDCAIKSLTGKDTRL